MKTDAPGHICAIMSNDPDTFDFAVETAELVAQLSGLILLAHVAWRLSPTRFAHMARVFHFVGETDQGAALRVRMGKAGGVRIKYQDICQ
ncbi:hypothetical protein GGE65_007423 [Skermanella aerolata]|uniref:hypothetical protein n=1 Tax=Skermanella aerolata TaxID=393310 RepID=UPI003D1F4B6D